MIDYKKVLMESRVLDILRDFDPEWIGTIPINVHIEGSDIDIACERKDGLVSTLITEFKGHSHFSLNESDTSIVCQFHFQNIPFEVYAEYKPTKLQNGYLHMKAEEKFLKIHGEKLREEVRRLKRLGLKTEPAFAQALGISGDPYQELLKFV